MRRLRNALLFFICAVILTACGNNGDGTEIPEETLNSPAPLPSASVTSDTVGNTGDGKFSLRYNPRASYNPYSGTDRDNMALSTLLYEGLFALNADFTARNVLCEDYTSTDTAYVFTIKSGVAMSDGSTLDAYDVKYSIDQARNSDKYKSRLRTVTGVSITGTLEVTVTLSRPHSSLPVLLDFPIVKYGYNGTMPPGTGPYQYTSADGIARLVRFDRHRDADRLPLDAIYLVACDDEQVGEYFTSSVIDLFGDDPNGTQTVRVHRDHETRYYNTTTLQYVGFNPRTSAISDSRVRRVIALAVDKQHIVDEALGGRAIASPLAISPAFSLYDASWEPAAPDDTRVEMSGLLRDAGLSDADNDSWFEYPVADGYAPITLDFIVPRENASRVAAAQSICDNLRRIGLNATLRQLPFDDYKTALVNGSFDLCYGETRLTADFDLLQLIAPGGGLNYGNMGNSELADLARSFLAADGEERAGLARDLCLSIDGNTTFIPVAYLQYAVHTGRGAVGGIELSQSGFFVGIENWIVDVDDL